MEKSSGAAEDDSGSCRGDTTKKVAVHPVKTAKGKVDIGTGVFEGSVKKSGVLHCGATNKGNKGNRGVLLWLGRRD